MEQENLDPMRELMTAGADVNTADRNGVSAPVESARCGRTKSLALLIAARADVNKPYKAGRTPLMHDLNARDYCGITALKTACLYKKIDIAKQLINAGCEVFAVVWIQAVEEFPSLELQLLPFYSSPVQLSTISKAVLGKGKLIAA